MCAWLLQSGSTAVSATFSPPGLRTQRLHVLPSAPPAPEEHSARSSTFVHICSLKRPWPTHHDEALQQLLRPLEDVGVCAETRRLSAAVRFQVSLVHTEKGGHQLAEIACSYLQETGRQHGTTGIRIVLQEVTLSRRQGW